MSKTVYLAFYAGKERNRAVSPAAETVTQYTLDSLSSIAKMVTLISPAQAIGNSSLPREEFYDGKNDIIYVASHRKLSKYNIPMRLFLRHKRAQELLAELNQQISDGDTLIVYHSMWLMKFVKQIIKKKKIKLILQICEIYSDVLQNKKMRKRELNYFKKADAYIFPTVLLNKIVNNDGKPFAIAHGTYEVEPSVLSNSISADMHTDSERVIHCVYAGTLDPRKGGAIAATTAATFLPKNYHIHILGFGSKAEIADMQKLILDTEKKSSASITYDGVLSGKDYTRFIQSCDIGLSTQNPDASFNATSFPSKILSYMANGLRVVSIRIPAVEGSAVDKYMYYYNRQTPEEIARAIRSVNLNDSYCGRQVISGLNDAFLLDLKQVFDRLNEIK